MKNKKTYLIIILVLIAVVTGIFIMKNTKTTIADKANIFSVADTSVVTKIFLADKQGRTITIERQADNSWQVNGKYRARKDLFNNLIDVMKRITVRNAVPKTEVEIVKKQLSATAVKVEIYSKEGKIKCYYLGGATMDGVGTYVLMENDNTPYVTEIPGFQGYLLPRYSTIEASWRDRELFRYSPEDVAQVQIDYAGRPELSFKLKYIDKNYIALTSGKGDTATQNLNGEYLRKYSTKFFDVQYYKLVTDKKPINVDTLTKNLLATIIITNRKAETNTAKIYKRFREEMDINGKVILVPDDYVLILAKNGAELIYTELLPLRDILITYPDFFVEKTQAQAN